MSMVSQPIFVTGIGTGVGKTIVSAILTEALEADYWKPVQAGVQEGTDSLQVKDLISNSVSVIHPELYKLSLAASPHIAARAEGVKIDLDEIRKSQPPGKNGYLVIEGAGGILVPLNEKEFVIDLMEILHAKVILVSRNYLGSINHSLLTAELCRQRKLNVSGWIFNDQYLNYEQEIVQWSGFREIGSVPFTKNISKEFVQQEAKKIKQRLLSLL